MTPESVLATQRQVFYRALLEQDWDALAHLYADDYMLVRSDGSVLTKTQVLEDLKTLNLVFESIELSGEQVRIVGPAAILTGSSTSKARNAGAAVKAHFRFVAVYIETSDGLKLLHFQSTALAK